MPVPVLEVTDADVEALVLEVELAVEALVVEPDALLELAEEVVEPAPPAPPTPALPPAQPVTAIPRTMRKRGWKLMEAVSDVPNVPFEATPDRRENAAQSSLAMSKV